MSQLWNFAKASRFIDLAASRLIDRANMARDSKVYPEAAALYEQALAMIPDDAAIDIQCGHMFKETGVLPKAEEHYKRAYELTPTTRIWPCRWDISTKFPAGCGNPRLPTRGR